MSQTVKRIVLTGVESTGKSTLTAALAEYFDTVWVREYAREYLNDLGREYVYGDLIKIAKGQIAAERMALKKANHYLFCDTGILVLKIWSAYKYGQCDPFILQELIERKYDLYVLCSIEDVAWEFDPLRENPDLNERRKIHQTYRKELKRLEIPFIEVSGNLIERKEQIIQYLKGKRNGNDFNEL